MDKNSKINIFVNEFTEKYDFSKLTYNDINRLADDYFFIFSESSLNKQEKRELLYRLCENLRFMNNIQNFLSKLNVIKNEPKKPNLEGVVINFKAQATIDELNEEESIVNEFGYDIITEDYLLDDIADEAVKRYINYDSPEEKISWN